MKVHSLNYLHFKKEDYRDKERYFLAKIKHFYAHM